MKIIKNASDFPHLDGSVGFVPTMGCLHEGHSTLIRHAAQLCDFVVVSIFVNPLQFGPNEDLAKYPRPFDADCALLESEKVALLFAPEVLAFYPEGFRTAVKVNQLAENLCGKARPGHFEGVATVCTKLFNVVKPQYAFFGEKDFQQVRVLEQLVSDLNMGIEIVRVPTVREISGLALSSRNRYLSETEKREAALIFKALAGAREKTLSQPALTVGEVKGFCDSIFSGASIDVEYLEICPEETLLPCQASDLIAQISEPHIFFAGRLGNARLIDNMSLARNNA